jgi:hypothetical protein
VVAQGSAAVPDQRLDRQLGLRACYVRLRDPDYLIEAREEL